MIVARMRTRGWPRSSAALLLGALGVLACAPASDRIDHERAADRPGATATRADAPTSGPPAPATNETITVRSQVVTEQAPLDLGLSDADYWDNPTRTRIDIETALLDAERSVLVIGAPKQVAFQQRETLPLLALRVDSQDNLARLRFRPTAVVVAVDLTTNTTYANMAVIEDIIEPPPYDGPPLAGMGGEAWIIDLREQLDLPWRRSELLVSLIMRESMTHRVRVSLSKGGYEDAAAAEYLAQVDAEPQAGQPFPPVIGDDDGEGLPSYRQHGESPAIPDAPGIALTVPRVIPRGPGLRVVVRGSFRVQALARELAPPGESSHTALVPITLVATGSDIATPFVFPLRAPVHGPVGPDSEVTGYFSVDLQQLGNFDIIDQTYFIYAFYGEHVTGPVPVAFVTR